MLRVVLLLFKTLASQVSTCSTCSKRWHILPLSIWRVECNFLNAINLTIVLSEQCKLFSFLVISKAPEHTTAMALIKSQLLASKCFLSLREQRVQNTRQFPGFSYKFPCLEISNVKLKPLPLGKTLQFNNGCEAKMKGINVSTTSTSLFRTSELLDAYEDVYDGVIVDPESLPSSANAFVAILQASISHWKLKGKKGIWLKILEEQAYLVPIALKEGFNYHHAEPGYVMLTYWIPNEPCMLPLTATHQVGVGAFVVNENREVLVVKEKKCPLTCSGIWKTPTGFINKSEEISAGAVREVKEETGINSTFMEVVAFRHAHQVTFEKSDLFFVCMLKPLSTEITIDDSEIQAAKWMPLDEFVEQPFHREDAMLRNVTDICISRYENHYRGFTACQIMSKFDDRLSYLYFRDLKDSTECLFTNQ